MGFLKAETMSFQSPRLPATRGGPGPARKLQRVGLSLLSPHPDFPCTAPEWFITWWQTTIGPHCPKAAHCKSGVLSQPQALEHGFRFMPKFLGDMNSSPRAHGSNGNQGPNGPKLCFFRKEGKKGGEDYREREKKIFFSERLQESK